jgi:hypothetical protein
MKIYKVIIKRQVQRVKNINSKAREGIIKIVIKEVRRFSGSGKRLE